MLIEIDKNKLNRTNNGHCQAKSMWNLSSFLDHLLKKSIWWLKSVIWKGKPSGNFFRLKFWNFIIRLKKKMDFPVEYMRLTHCLITKEHHIFHLDEHLTNIIWSIYNKKQKRKILFQSGLVHVKLLYLKCN